MRGCGSRGLGSWRGGGRGAQGGASQPAGGSGTVQEAWNVLGAGWSVSTQASSEGLFEGQTQAFWGSGPQGSWEDPGQGAEASGAVKSLEPNDGQYPLFQIREQAAQMGDDLLREPSEAGQSQVSRSPGLSKIHALSKTPCFPISSIKCAGAVRGGYMGRWLQAERAREPPACLDSQSSLYESVPLGKSCDLVCLTCLICQMDLETLPTSWGCVFQMLSPAHSQRSVTSAALEVIPADGQSVSVTKSDSSFLNHQSLYQSPAYLCFWLFFFFLS